MDAGRRCGTVAVMIRIRTLLLLALTAAGGCAPPDEPPTPGRSAPAGPEATARQLVADLLGIEAAQIEVVSVEAREFSDASLDCPQPGMSYAQVITPGYRVLLEADGRRFDVRTSGGHGRICRRHKPGESDTAPRGNTPAVSELAESARRQLAAQLDANPDSVALLGIRNRQPGEVLRGCEGSCKEKQDCGYVIQLGFDQRRYTYLADGGELAPCPAIETS